MLLSELKWGPTSSYYENDYAPWEVAVVKPGVNVYRSTEHSPYPPGEYVFAVANMFGERAGYFPGGTEGVTRTADPITAQALLFHYLGVTSEVT